MCMNPTMSSELRTKVGSDGKLYGYYKTTISKQHLAGGDGSR